MAASALPLAASSLAPALVGLLGVVVGAAINGYAQYVFARRRERADARSHGRLVEADLQRAAAVAEQYVDAPFRHSPGWADDLRTPAWQEGRAVLASALDRAAWLVLRDAFEAVAAFRRSLETTDSADDRARQRNERHAKATLEGARAAAGALAGALGERADGSRSRP